MKKKRFLDSYTITTRTTVDEDFLELSKCLLQLEDEHRELLHSAASASTPAHSHRSPHPVQSISKPSTATRVSHKTRPTCAAPLIWRLVHRKWTILYRWNQSLMKQVCPLRYLLNLPRLSWLTNLLISILFFLQSSHLSSVLERLPSHQYVSFCHHWFFSPSPAI